MATSALSKVSTLLRPIAARRSIGPIGIDFGLESVHLVQFESVNGASPTLRARASVPIVLSREALLDDPAELRAVLRKALSSDAFKGREAVVALPVGLFRTMSINYLSSPEKDDGAAVLRVMKDRLDGDLADYVIDYLPVNSRSKNNERLALVAVSEREPIVALLEALRRAGLTVDALEIGPVAIGRLVSALAAENDSGNALVINAGRDASYLTLISGDDLLFDQQIRFGENALVNQLAETLDLSGELARDLMMRGGIQPSHDAVASTIDEAGLGDTIAEILKPEFLRLVDEIKRVCLYAAAETRGGAVNKVYLLGSLAHWPGADELLGNLADMHVEKIQDPLQTFRTDEAHSGEAALSPELAVATGLALRESDHYG
ncbi:MAG: pilus assembly protein PilM [Woeseiaceae bacterium]|nr:pilus assembly protein PilM [Woeseiaceae bacterium]